jgi:ketosteroid isomerase-like protein
VLEAIAVETTAPASGTAARRDTSRAMSERNVEIVREAIDKISARRVPDHLMAADVEIQNARTAVTDNLYVGRAGILEWQRDFFGVMDDEARLEVEETIAAGSDCVVVMLRLIGRGSASSAPLELRWPTAFWLRDGRITRAVGYLTRRDALEAAGLSGQG